MDKMTRSDGVHEIDPNFIGTREQQVARAYIEAAARNPDTFVDLISPEDEMYIVTRDRIADKALAKYSYLADGRDCFKSIANVLRSTGKSFSKLRTFLDFVSGYGRVTRFLIEEIEPRKIWVSDIYKDAVDFQKQSFGVNGFYSESEPGRVVFPGKFEIIYAGSLFSHLPANRFEQWLSTLFNSLDNDGLLIFSTHGEWFCPEAHQIDSSGFTFIDSSESRSLSTEEYGSTFARRDWVEKLCRRIGIANIRFLEKDLRGFQDIYVAARNGAPPMTALTPARYLMGHIDAVQITGDSNLCVSGWAMAKVSDDPVKQISIYANNEFLGNATLGISRPDVATHFGRADCLSSGWQLNVEKSVLIRKLSRAGGLNIIKASIKSESDDVTHLFSSFDTA